MLSTELHGVPDVARLDNPDDAVTWLVEETGHVGHGQIFFRLTHG